MPRKTKAISIEHLVRTLREQQVILDTDLAELYQVPNKILLQAVKRNADRFPGDFVFRLEKEEVLNLKSQTVISSWGGRRDLPLAFTAEGVAMLSSVLQSPRAIAANVSIMREFVRLRKIANLREAVVRKLDALEKRVGDHDVVLQNIFTAIQQMMGESQKPKPKIGFGREHEAALKAKKASS